MLTTWQDGDFEDSQRNRFSFFLVFKDFHGLHDFHRFSQISGHGCLKLGTTVMLRPACPIETLARFQDGFLSSEDLQRIMLQIFIELYRFS